MTLMSPKVTRITLVTKSLVFMRFLSISINLLEFFRIMSFVFDLKYLSQNLINFNMLGVFWKPQDKQFPKLSLDLHLKQHLKEILRFFTAAGAFCHHCMYTIKYLKNIVTLWRCFIKYNWRKSLFRPSRRNNLKLRLPTA